MHVVGILFFIILCAWVMLCVPIRSSGVTSWGTPVIAYLCMEGGGEYRLNDTVLFCNVVSFMRNSLCC